MAQRRNVRRNRAGSTTNLFVYGAHAMPSFPSARLQDGCGTPTHRHQTEAEEPLTEDAELVQHTLLPRRGHRQPRSVRPTEAPWCPTCFRNNCDSSLFCLTKLNYRPGSTRCLRSDAPPNIRPDDEAMACSARSTSRTSRCLFPTPAAPVFSEPATRNYARRTRAPTRSSRCRPRSPGSMTCADAELRCRTVVTLPPNARPCVGIDAEAPHTVPAGRAQGQVEPALVRDLAADGAPGRAVPEAKPDSRRPHSSGQWSRQ